MQFLSIVTTRISGTQNGAPAPTPLLSRIPARVVPRETVAGNPLALSRPPVGCDRLSRDAAPAEDRADLAAPDIARIVAEKPPLHRYLIAMGMRAHQRPGLAIPPKPTAAS